MLRRSLVVGYGLLGCGAGPLGADSPHATPRRASLAPVSVSSMNAPPPPPTRRQELVETLFGAPVADPYRWLEQFDDPEVKAWVASQNAFARRTLDQAPSHGSFSRRLEELLTIGELSLPWVRRVDRERTRLFYTQRDGGQNQPVLWVRDSDGPARVLFDPNAERADGTLSLDYYAPSRDGKLLAYGVSLGGSEEATLYLREVDSGRLLPDTITRARYSSVCWLPGNQRFFYSRFPAPGSVPAGEEHYHRRIYEHVLGRDPDRDPLRFAAPKMTDFPSCTVSPSGRWLVIRVHESWSKTSLYLADTQRPSLEFTRITPEGEHVYDPVITDNALFVRSNSGASRYALFAAAPEKAGREHWRLVVPEHAQDVLSEFNFVGGRLFVGYLSNAASRLEQFAPDGRSLGEVPLPTVGTNNGVSGLQDGAEAYFDFESVAAPPVIQRLSLKDGSQKELHRVAAPLSTDAFVATRREATSKDGTRVPFLLVHAKDVDPRQGPHRTMLYGYGGFNVSLQPRFSRTLIAWLERGGIYVQANLRGGGEQGEAWHRAGRREQKQNVFDDFYAVAERLIADGVTSPSALGIYGRSNGGLLVAAAVTQRPALFRAAVSSVPLADMLRFDRFLIAKLWTSEYGSPDAEPDFHWLRAYSPYHNVQPNNAYPAVLLTSAESDTRVHPVHAMKFGAALQHAQSAPRPVLVRIDADAGHGQGKPTRLLARETADVYSFLWSQLDPDPDGLQSETELPSN
ncbi:MAG: S9 family peptidase [Polyangiaceae bacterium]|nr:S9 family peptidase [Polyangiaceae bacterium]